MRFQARKNYIPKMSLKTPLCGTLEIQVPVVQAPIGSATCPALAAAISNAGGLGMLSVSWRDTKEVRQVIKDTFALTGKPFGVNLALEWPQEERLKICLEEGVKIVSLFWGNPAPYIPAAHKAGAIVMHTVGSAAEARQAVGAGVDIVVGQGWEAGGHVWGQVATMPLIPRIVDAVHPVPVIAAGGIGDGRGLVAALALGAQAVWLGTRFLMSEEASVHPIYKEKVLQAQETDTIYSSTFDRGWPNAPHRTLRNSTIIEWEKSNRPTHPNRPGEGDTIAFSADGKRVERYSDMIPLPGMTGDLEALALYAGQSVGLISQIKPARRILLELMDEACETLKRIKSLI